MSVKIERDGKTIKNGTHSPTGLRIVVEEINRTGNNMTNLYQKPDLLIRITGLGGGRTDRELLNGRNGK